MNDSQQRVQLTIEVDSAADPIQGVVRHPCGADKPFAGWTALVRAIELALAAERAREEEP
jgi:hypothetical protein